MTNPSPFDPAGGPPAPWQALVDPGALFAHPDEVLAAPDLTREEKRAVLASWASDAWAVESAPGLRQCPGLVGRTVPLDDVLKALCALDDDGSAAAVRAPDPGGRKGRVRWLTARRRAGWRRGGRDGGEDGGLRPE